MLTKGYFFQGMKMKSTQSILLTLLFFLLIMGLGGPAKAAGSQFYFSAMVEPNEDQGEIPQVVLQWGGMDGGLPDGIAAFRLYRSTNGGVNVLLTELPYSPAPTDAGELCRQLENDLGWRQDMLLATLENIGRHREAPVDVTLDNYADFLISIFTGSDRYAPLQKALLLRRFPGLGSALGLAYIDDTVSPTATYVYTLTALDADGFESTPLGRTDSLSPATISRLPAPADFAQVYNSKCDALKKGLDDMLIHFSWQVPAGPADLGLRLQTVGYDIFWSATDLGALDLRQGIPADLHPMNSEPIVVSGPVDPDGDAPYLAKDNGAGHAGLDPAWRRGQVFYYYIAALDITGRYGITSGPLEATVTDAMPPRAVWGVRTYETSIDTSPPFLPHLALAWDRVDRANFVNEYASGKTICSVDDEQICYSTSPTGCRAGKNLVCEDFDVDTYHLFRYPSPEEAARGNGLDSDGDLWSDIAESSMGTDPCDPESHPASFPPNHVAPIPAGSNEVGVGPGHVQISYIDTEVGADDYGKVYWYRIVAVDKAGNAGPVTPPIRGVLYDRTQPAAAAFIQTRSCSDQITFDPSTNCAEPQVDEILHLENMTKSAARVTLQKQCNDQVYSLLSKPMSATAPTIINADDFAGRDCKEVDSCPGGEAPTFFLNFYDPEGAILGREIVTLGDICTPSFQGCVAVFQDCVWQTVPGEVSVGQVPEDGEVRICVELEDGQMARLYHDGDNGSSPFANVSTDDCDFTSDPLCTVCRNVEERAITGDRFCPGVRVFNKNHVGSVINHLGCLSMEALPVEGWDAVPAPLLATVTQAHDEQAMDITWAAQAPAISAFTLTYASETGTKMIGIPAASAAKDHQFSHRLPLADDEINKRWCFKMKALNRALQSSPWSNEICAAFETKPATPFVSWPHVQAPPVLADEPLAFYLHSAAMGDDRHDEPVILLSDDLSQRLTAENSGCVDDLISCPDNKVTSCLDNSNGVAVSGCRLCNVVSSSLQQSNFIVYRQEQGSEFVQVSPLIEKVHCRVDDQQIPRIDTLEDPFIYLVNIHTDAVAGGIAPALATGARLIFRDRYPHERGATVRYKIVTMDQTSGEIAAIKHTNWLTIPE